MLSGGCLCGAVRYRYDGELTEVVACHCQQCKRAQGGVFALNAPLEQAKLSLQCAAGALAEYRHTPQKKRVFCRCCGSPIYSQHDAKPTVVRLRLGTLDVDQLPPPNYHIYHSSVVSWCRFDPQPARYAQAKPEGEDLAD